MDNYKITQYSVNSILGFVESGQIAIPEIQRPFVWKEKEVKDLIDSLYEGYPIGYLIVWQNSKVRIRGFGKGGTKKILIDGQQRVTALMAALLGKDVLDDEYRAKKIRIAFNPLADMEEENFAVTNEAIEEDPRWIPDISVLFRKNFSFRQFEKEYIEKNPGQDFSALETKIDTLKGIVKHQVGIIELSFQLDIDVVSEIFIRINLQGKPLNQEDFAMSKISVNEEYDGDYIRNTIDYFCHLLKEPDFYKILSSGDPEFISSKYGKAISWCKDASGLTYSPSYGDVLKVVLIASFGKTKVGDLVNLLSGKTGRRGQISKQLAKESFAKLGEGVLAFVSEKNFRGFLQALEKAGYTGTRLLYSQSILNYTYAMYLLMDRKGISDKEKASLIGKWMTMALITGHYQGSPDSVVSRDVENIEEEGFASYLAQIESLRMGDDFFEAVLPDRFASTTARTAPYLAYLAALSAEETLSLYSKDVKVADLYEARAESCQILPRAFLAKCGFRTREVYGQIANITYLSSDVKSLIRKKSPADYKDSLDQLMTEEEIKGSLAALDLDQAIFEVNEDSVEAFLGDRRKKMAARIRNHYGNL